MDELPVSLDDWLALLERRHHTAIDLGLDRCREVWLRMGSPLPASKIFVVAGTNGKGSTVATICSLLGSLGFFPAVMLERFSTSVANWVIDSIASLTMLRPSTA